MIHSPFSEKLCFIYNRFIPCYPMIDGSSSEIPIAGLIWYPPISISP